jgi:hypothetical protein
MIGYDTREIAAFHTLVHSIICQVTYPIAITPIALHYLEHVLTREPIGATQFSLSRFLTPWLAQYQGYAVYLDCDMLLRGDLSDILIYTITQPDKAIWVCQHEYTPSTATKMWGVENQPYPRKNWSSAILWNTAKCRMLTPDYINQATPMELHRFAWLPDEQIGSLPLEWNWLVGEYPPNPEAKVLHYTLGTPNLEGHGDCDHADLWWAAHQAMRAACQD